MKKFWTDERCKKVLSCQRLRELFLLPLDPNATDEVKREREELIKPFSPEELQEFRYFIFFWYPISMKKLNKELRAERKRAFEYAAEPVPEDPEVVRARALKSDICYKFFRNPAAATMYGWLEHEFYESEFYRHRRTTPLPERTISQPYFYHSEFSLKDRLRTNKLLARKEFYKSKGLYEGSIKYEIEMELDRINTKANERFERNENIKAYGALAALVVCVIFFFTELLSGAIFGVMFAWWLNAIFVAPLAVLGIKI